MARTLEPEDLGTTEGCRHDAGPAMVAVRDAFRAFFTAARRNALRAELTNRLPGVDWDAPGMLVRAARKALELEPDA
jgi:hypothetical protein